MFRDHLATLSQTETWCQWAWPGGLTLKQMRWPSRSWPCGALSTQSFTPRVIRTLNPVVKGMFMFSATWDRLQTTTTDYRQTTLDISKIWSVLRFSFRATPLPHHHADSWLHNLFCLWSFLLVLSIPYSGLFQAGKALFTFLKRVVPDLSIWACVYCLHVDWSLWV